jgi:hypothetical protein
VIVHLRHYCASFTKQHVRKCIIVKLLHIYFVYNLFVMLLSDSFVRGYIKEVRTVQEQEGSTEDIFIHRTNLRGGYKTYELKRGYFNS